MAEDMHGIGACMEGGHVLGGVAGGMRGRGHVRYGGMLGRGMYGMGCAWQGTCMVGGMLSRGHTWQGTCMIDRGVHGRRDGHCNGRYASYLNAFLYVYKSKTFVKYPGVLIRGHQHQHKPIILANFPENLLGVK